MTMCSSPCITEYIIPIYNQAECNAQSFNDANLRLSMMGIECLLLGVHLVFGFLVLHFCNGCPLYDSPGNFF